MYFHISLAVVSKTNFYICFIFKKNITNMNILYNFNSKFQTSVL